MQLKYHTFATVPVLIVRCNSAVDTIFTLTPHCASQVAPLTMTLSELSGHDRCMTF